MCWCWQKPGCIHKVISLTLPLWPLLAMPFIHFPVQDQEELGSPLSQGLIFPGLLLFDPLTTHHSKVLKWVSGSVVLVSLMFACTGHSQAKPTNCWIPDSSENFQNCYPFMQTVVMMCPFLGTSIFISVTALTLKWIGWKLHWAISDCLSLSANPLTVVAILWTGSVMSAMRRALCLWKEYRTMPAFQTTMSLSAVWLSPSVHLPRGSWCLRTLGLCGYLTSRLMWRPWSIPRVSSVLIWISRILLTPTMGYKGSRPPCPVCYQAC